MEDWIIGPTTTYVFKDHVLVISVEFSKSKETRYEGISVLF